MSPLTAAARSEHGSLRATTAGASGSVHGTAPAQDLTIELGSVYGGATAQDFPVVIETTMNRRKVVKANIAIRLTCTAGGTVTFPDGYTAMSIRKRKFSASFGPATNRNDDGTTSDLEGSIIGAFNKARRKASGKWSLKLTVHDASGAITDTCDSGSISWTAKA
jgi:hypothetical protein